MGDRPGRNCSTTYQCGQGAYQIDLNKVFPSKYAANTLGKMNESVLCDYPGLALHVWFKETADIMAPWLAQWVQHRFFILF